jgi:diaminohydroxyphosphoribosylaminopyrimidine deaminase / 5-amino-6-(5-phosphoribosylamino)uracil reductase
MSEADRAHMAHALRLGARGLGRCWPNPAVGAVIVQSGRIVGRGWTQPGGRPHAETMALQQAGALAKGATVYVTLEPCAHHGKTPPCADALIAAGVARVVTALTDPDPRVAGRGHARLRAAGIEVTEGVMEAEAREVNAGFLKRVEQGLPLVTLKLATTLDGRIATASGESRWITGEASRRAVHALRLSHDAVMVGSGTALADDPDLTVRDLGAPAQPVRIVLDSGLRFGAQSRLGRSVKQGPVWLLHGPKADAQAAEGWRAAGGQLIPVAAKGDHLDLTLALKSLAERGLTRVFCEGGGGLAAALVKARLVDELVLFTAGKLIGAEGSAGLGALALTSLADAPGLNLRRVEQIGADVMSRWAFD